MQCSKSRGFLGKAHYVQWSYHCTSRIKWALRPELCFQQASCLEDFWAHLLLRLFSCMDITLQRLLLVLACQADGVREKKARAPPTPPFFDPCLPDCSWRILVCADSWGALTLIHLLNNPSHHSPEKTAQHTLFRRGNCCLNRLSPGLILCLL